MKLVSYSNGDGSALHAGVMLEDVIVNAERAAAHAGLDGNGSWSSVRGIIEGADADALAKLSTAAGELAGEGIARSEVVLGPPIPDPNKVLCIGLNYRDHVKEAEERNPDAGKYPDPVVFSKFTTALIGDGADVVLPAAAPEMVDWEGELAVVIGKETSRVSADEALGHVAGYMVFNDVSARDVQLASPQWLMGKSFDTAGPCGPVLVTADEVPDPQALELKTEVNGEVVQSTTTSLMINPVARLIEYISSLITLQPGDVIATGTPGGVGFARDPQVFLKAGDTVTVTISGLGQLSNPVVAEGA